MSVVFLSGVDHGDGVNGILSKLYFGFLEIHLLHLLKP
jgi:hypothetical protein